MGNNGEIKSFKDLDYLVSEIRDKFQSMNRTKTGEFGDSVEVFFGILSNVHKILEIDTTKKSRETDFISVLVKAINEVLTMYYLVETGFFELSLSMKRNFVELYLVATAIGFDEVLYSDWKHKNTEFKSVHNLVKAIRKSRKVPSDEKSYAVYLTTEWIKSSTLFSHQLTPKSIGVTLFKDSARIAVSLKQKKYYDGRLNLLTNMVVNLSTLLTNVFDYGKIVKKYDGNKPNKLLVRLEKLQNKARNSETY